MACDSREALEHAPRAHGTKTRTTSPSRARTVTTIRRSRARGPTSRPFAHGATRRRAPANAAPATCRTRDVDRAAAVRIYLELASRVTDGRHDTGPDPDRRRSAGHPRRAAAAAARRGLRGRRRRARPREALERLEAADFDLAILDLNYTRDTTSGQEGFDLMERIRALDPTLPVLVDDRLEQRGRRGRGDAPRRARLHREAVGRRAAAGDGADADRPAARGAGATSGCRRRNARLQRGATPAFIGDSPAIVEVRQTIERIAPSDAAVLITGEHGTGKEVVADLAARAVGSARQGRSSR